MARRAVSAMNNEIISRLVADTITDAELEEACAIMADLMIEADL